MSIDKYVIIIASHRPDITTYLLVMKKAYFIVWPEKKSFALPGWMPLSRSLIEKP